MATDDVVDIDSPCPCGGGNITVTQTSPDHPWATASQIHYSATLNCLKCSSEFVVRNEYSGNQPWLARKVDVAARSDAEAAHRLASEAFAKSDLAQILVPLIVADIDSQKSRAAKHRVLTKYHLAHESYSTYLKYPYDGAKAVQRISGDRLAEIGADFQFAGIDPTPFKVKAIELEALQKKIWATQIPAVKTGARWMRV